MADRFEPDIDSQPSLVLTGRELARLAELGDLPSPVGLGEFERAPADVQSWLDHQSDAALRSRGLLSQAADAVVVDVARDLLTVCGRPNVVVSVSITDETMVDTSVFATVGHLTVAHRTPALGVERLIPLDSADLLATISRLTGLLSSDDITPASFPGDQLVRHIKRSLTVSVMQRDANGAFNAELMAWWDCGSFGLWLVEEDTGNADAAQQNGGMALTQTSGADITGMLLRKLPDGLRDLIRASDARRSGQVAI